MKPIKSIYLVFLLSFAMLKLKAQDKYFSTEPSMIKKDYAKLNKRYDTLLTYERTCGGCSEGMMSTVYFFYRDARNSYLRVYRKNLTTRKASRVDIVKNDNIKKVLDYAIQNFDSLSLISGVQDLYTEYKITKISDSTYRKELVRGSGAEDGPRTYCYIKLGNKSVSNILYGVVEVKEYFTVSPLIGNFFTLIHDAYSKYTKTQILDINW